ncbi:MAG: hypothetical protein M3326_09745, partial [Actinomycetota bacterium]|nr:hypothetical protein [Actinomycetota bacterium]
MRTRWAAGERRAASGALAVLTVFVAVVFVFAPPASASSVSNVTTPVLSSPAAGVGAVEYTFDFTVSPTGAMTSASTVTVTAPAGT